MPLPDRFIVELGSDTHRTFMYRQKIADTMPCSVAIIYTSVPQWFTSYGVERITFGSFGKDGRRKSYVSLEANCEIFFLLFSDCPCPNCTGNIGRSIEVLSSRIDQQ